MIRCCGRMINAGRFTNYEMERLRDAKDFGRYRVRRIKRKLPHWAGIWAGVSNAFHPRSEEHWRTHVDREDM